MSALKLSFFLIGSEIGEIPAGAQYLIYTVSFLESLLISVESEDYSMDKISIL